MLEEIKSSIGLNLIPEKKYAKFSPVDLRNLVKSYRVSKDMVVSNMKLNLDLILRFGDNVPKTGDGILFKDTSKLNYTQKIFITSLKNYFVENKDLVYINDFARSVDYYFGPVKEFGQIPQDFKMLADRGFFAIIGDFVAFRFGNVTEGEADDPVKSTILDNLYIFRNERYFSSLVDGLAEIAGTGRDAILRNILSMVLSGQLKAHLWGLSK